MTPTQAFVNVGDRFRSIQKKDRGRTIEVVSDHGNGYYTVRNVVTGRRTDVNGETLAKNYERAARRDRTGPAPRRQPARKSTPPLNEREAYLIKLIKQKFSEFHQRGQHLYIGAGMSTTHVAWSMFKDADSVQLFWPKALIQERFGGGRTYVMQGDFGKRVDEAIRNTLAGLEKKGLLEKVGNTDERRWKPTYIDS